MDNPGSSLILAATGAALAMTLIVAVRYVLTSGLFAWLTERRTPGLRRHLPPQFPILLRR